jgi:hypothetical protein
MSTFLAMRAFVRTALAVGLLLGSTAAPEAQEPQRGSGAGRTLFVDAAALCAGADGSLAAPFCRIQDAIAQALDGDRVLVAPGTYGEEVDFLGKAITVRSMAGAQVTTIAPGTLSAVVTFASGEGRRSVLAGFTLTAGSSGVLCEGSSPTVRLNVIRDNVGFDEGAGVRCLNASPLIQQNEIRQNESWPGAGTGGGVYATGGAPRIEHNLIADNVSFGVPIGVGAGLAFFSSAPTGKYNLIVRHRGVGPGGNFGGGIYAHLSDVELIGNTLAGNVAPTGNILTSRGGGLRVFDSTVLVSDTIVWGNTAPSGAAIWVDGASGVALVFTDVDLTRTVVEPGGALLAGQGTLGVDPAFVNAPGGDYHLLASSPLVDRGDPRTAGGTDGDGEARVVDGDGDGDARVDIGWDERPRAP